MPDRDVDHSHSKENRRVVVPEERTDEGMDISEVKLEFSCRRFINDGGSIYRVEYGVCGDKDCGECFQQSGQWQDGIPFVAITQQLRYIREFF